MAGEGFQPPLVVETLGVGVALDVGAARAVESELVYPVDDERVEAPEKALAELL